MLKKFAAAPVRQNPVNLLIIAVVIFFVFGCFCRSEREAVVSDQTNSATREKNFAGKTPAPSENTDDKNSDDGDFVVEHAVVQNARYREIDRQIKSEKVLENAANRLNQALILPYDIALRTKDCGQVNALYDPNDHSVTVCYELMEYYYKLFKSTGKTDDAAYEKMNNAVRFAFLHEIGHALIDTYKLPIMGNEEDAADRCSSYISLEEIPDGVKYVLAAADAFAVESKMSASENRNPADEHLLQKQRFYNSLCLIYGSNADKYDYFVTENYLPKERAVRCPNEFERTMQSWKELLKPWRKD